MVNIKDKLANSRGIMKRNDGDKYKGGWKDNKKH